MEFDFLPTRKNQLYHIVSNEWYSDWKKWVGIAENNKEMEEVKDDEQPSTTASTATEKTAKQNFKNLDKKQRKVQKKNKKGKQVNQDEPEFKVEDMNSED